MEKNLKHFGDDIETLGKDIDLPLVRHIGANRRHTAQSLTWHYHQGCELLFVLLGAAAYEFRQHQPIQVPGGHFLLIPPGIEHRGAQNVRPPSTICGLLLNPDCSQGCLNTPLAKQDLRWLSRCLDQSAPILRPFSSDVKQALERLSKAQQAFAANRHSRFLKATLRLWACALILEAVHELTLPRPSGPNALVVAAKDYLRRHLSEPIRMSDLVKHIGLGQSRLFDLFKSATGLTPNDYLLRLRIEKAKELLAQQRYSVTYIALEVGFSSAQYFSDVFRRYAGQTPRDYRQQAANGDPHHR